MAATPRPAAPLPHAADPKAPDASRGALVPCSPFRSFASPGRRKTLQICLAEAFDHLGDGCAFRACREIQRHTVAQNRMRQRQHVINRRRKAAFKQRAGPDREHECLTRTWAWTPGHKVAHGLAGIVIRPPGTDETENRLHDFLAYRQTADQRLRL